MTFLGLRFTTVVQGREKRSRTVPHFSLSGLPSRSGGILAVAGVRAGWENYQF